MNRLSTPHGSLDLTRYPPDPRDPLRAWDAADEYLLRYLGGDTPEDVTGPAGAAYRPRLPADLHGQRVVILGDRWGALTASLAAYAPTQISDSRLTQQATRANLDRNGLTADPVRLLTTQEPPPDRIDVLLVRVPKSLALLEDQLHRLAPALHASSVVIGTGMVKEIHTSTLTLFEQLVGPTRTTLATKKARLILTTPDPAPARPANPWPHTYTLPTDLGPPLAGRPVVNHAGVFCPDRLDIGTRFLLTHLPARTGPDRVIDLGCGNGVVGTAAALANPDASVVFTDESYQAVASAEATFRASAPAGAKAEFVVGDALADAPPASADLILNNPPFHTHQATTDRTALRMFQDAHRALRPGGELLVVGNRHLGYHVTLKRIFGACTVVASNPKFVILRAVKR
ncbi:methyltransferase [Streptomyces sp. NPDC051940]|uniref:methyltransferase n=1 Tax=Streptomyces sp. NPDC051940 TaxID=3155675 RepID=UPI003430301B